MTDRGWGDWITGSLPQMPTLTREVEIPVYMIHQPGDAEDYFFLLDFEAFMERSQSGFFVRPKLRIWAGRDDFDRRAFAGHFRGVFAAEFDKMRTGAGARKTGGLGWLDFDFGIGLVGAALSSFVANVVLLIALGAGRAIFGELKMPGWLKGKSAEVKTEERIEATKAKVDDALTRIDVTLHRDLYSHAYRGQAPGKLSGMDYEAWPLPAYVREHLDDGKSGSWW